MQRGITPKQLRAVNMKLDGRTPTEIARVLEVWPTTIHNWFRDPVVNTYYLSRLQDIHDATQTALKSTSCAAATAHRAALEMLVEIVRGQPRIKLPDNLQEAIDGGGRITVKITVSYTDQIAAARTINQIAQAAQDRGGHPRTERQEVTTQGEGELRPKRHLTPEQLREKIRMIKGGRG